jgi:succinate dehydrogenase/fumarate reductase flavoprotein subunit
MSDRNRFRVIVIGGGLAGLSAAHHLVKPIQLKNMLTFKETIFYNTILCQFV